MAGSSGFGLIRSDVSGHGVSIAATGGVATPTRTAPASAVAPRIVLTAMSDPFDRDGNTVEVRHPSQPFNVVVLTRGQPVAVGAAGLVRQLPAATLVTPPM